MKGFVICRQDGEEIFVTKEGEFTANILQLFDFYVVKVFAKGYKHSEVCGVYRDINEAADRVRNLKAFASRVTGDNECFQFSEANPPITAIELVDEFDSREA